VQVHFEAEMQAITMLAMKIQAMKYAGIEKIVNLQLTVFILLGAPPLGTPVT